ncbi:MAG: ComF family protein [Patescibacteria group bacterium]|nr:ComF family protein [Patescibacteria group bacterium]
MGILDFLFPKYCVNCKKIGSYLCGNCFSYLSFDDEKICVVCDRPSINSLTHPRCQTKYAIDGVFTSLAYKGVVKKLVYKFKYNPYLSDLKNLLIELFYEGLIQKEDFYRVFSKDSVFVPIPLHPSKLKKRGYNQSQILAEELSKKFGNRVVNLLERVKDTKTQAGLKKDDRKKNIIAAFVLKRSHLDQGETLNGKTIFIVDDVLTTGSTFLEAAKVLKKGGAKRVFGLALARD